MAWQLDLMNTQIGFTVNHMMVTTVRGQFKTLPHELDLNEQHPEASGVAMTIGRSIDTGADYRDSHLRERTSFTSAVSDDYL